MEKTIFLFGSKGYLSQVLASILQSDWKVLGICGAREFDKAKRLRSKLSWFANEVGLTVDQNLILALLHLSEPFEIADPIEFQNFIWQNFTTIVSPIICQNLNLT